MVSSAQVSDARIYALSLLPMTRGLNPCGSLAPISLRGDIITKLYAPFNLGIAAMNPDQNDSYELDISINDIRNILNTNLDIASTIHQKIVKISKCCICEKNFNKKLMIYHKTSLT